MQHLGVVLSPFGANGPGWGTEVAMARGGKWGSYLQPTSPYPTTDRFFNTRGEVGFYYDTQLGGLGDMIPTDAEMAKSYSSYTPVHSGWINAKEGYVPGPWRFGWNPALTHGPKTSLSGLGATTVPKLIALAAMAAVVGGTALYKKQIMRKIRKLRRK